MNLRENKIEKYKNEEEKTKFLGVGKNRKKLTQAPKQRRIAPALEKKKLQQQRNEKWVRKAPKKPLAKEKLDYQEHYEYEKEYSQYLQQSRENIIVNWRGPEFEHYPRSKQWYTGALIILSLIVLYAVIKGGILMAIVFALIGLVGYLILSQPQKVIDFAVTYDGILVGDEIYDFDDIQSFWIFYEPPHTRVISLHMKGYFRPYLHIPLHQVDPVDVYRALVEFIPEEKQEQNIVDIMERLFRM
ncbi:MAG: hypothetical protein CR972_01285 [Candidatus Moraniibacteriota bacterium]|nr:MAG: hypothetical protein CR972_01285 [Candidatus Moranbacteria bacterium]